jgi:hypothetical protein
MVMLQNLYFLPDMIALTDIYEELKFFMTITHYATNMSMIFLSVESLEIKEGGKKITTIEIGATNQHD